jgi:hypothetical protein
LWHFRFTLFVVLISWSSVALRSLWHWTMFSESRLKTPYHFDFLNSLRNNSEHAEVNDLNSK